MKRALIALLAVVSVANAMPQGSGIIAGRLLHADGTPAIGILLAALPEGNQGAVIRNPEHRARTDSAGRYRIEDVRPGGYLVATGKEINGNSGNFVQNPHYFPGVADPSTATVVIVAGATALPDFRLAAQPVPQTAAFRVSGRVLGDWQALKRGRPAQGYVRVELSPTGVRCGGTPLFVGAVTSDGVFEMRDVPPGKYATCLVFVNADAYAIANGLSAVVNVDGQTIADLTFDFDQKKVTVLGQPTEKVPEQIRPIR